MSELPNVLGTMLADLATRITNTALNSDPELAGRLGALDGNTIEFNCITPDPMPNQIWHFLIDAEQLLLRHGPADAPQAIVAGTALDLGRAIFNGDMSGTQIEGDEVLLEQLQRILGGFRPDFAQPLQRLFGTGASQTILGTAEMGLNGLRSAVEGLGQTITGQATANTVDQKQLDTILTSIDELRLKVDRLSAELAQSRKSEHE
ncbi:MAG: hypothetical protein AAF541_00080 [Pseudomonadota bacterium]